MRWQEEEASPKVEGSKRTLCETTFRLFSTGMELQGEHIRDRLAR